MIAATPTDSRSPRLCPPRRKCVERLDIGHKNSASAIERKVRKSHVNDAVQTNHGGRRRPRRHWLRRGDKPAHRSKRGYDPRGRRAQRHRVRRDTSGSGRQAGTGPLRPQGHTGTTLHSTADTLLPASHPGRPAVHPPAGLSAATVPDRRAMRCRAPAALLPASHAGRAAVHPPADLSAATVPDRRAMRFRAPAALLPASHPGRAAVHPPAGLSAATAPDRRAVHPPGPTTGVKASRWPRGGRAVAGMQASACGTASWSLLAAGRAVRHERGATAALAAAAPGRSPARRRCGHHREARHRPPAPFGESEPSEGSGAAIRPRK